MDDRSGKSAARCMTAPSLLHAIRSEYRLGDGQASMDNAVQIALSRPDHVFHFSNPATLNNMARADSDEFIACAIIGKGGQARLPDVAGAPAYEWYSR
jgi:hypothetical protein